VGRNIHTGGIAKVSFGGLMDVKNIQNIGKMKNINDAARNK
jgi:hypothetical protein